MASRITIAVTRVFNHWSNRTLMIIKQQSQRDRIIVYCLLRVKHNMNLNILLKHLLQLVVNVFVTQAPLIGRVLQVVLEAVMDEPGLKTQYLCLNVVLRHTVVSLCVLQEQCTKGGFFECIFNIMNCFLKFQLLYYSFGYSKYNIICTYYNVLPKYQKSQSTYLQYWLRHSEKVAFSVMLAL